MVDGCFFFKNRFWWMFFLRIAIGFDWIIRLWYIFFFFIYPFSLYPSRNVCFARAQNTEEQTKLLTEAAGLMAGTKYGLMIVDSVMNL